MINAETRKVLAAEAKELYDQDFDWCTIEPDIENFLLWHITMLGPDDKSSPYHDGAFMFELFFNTHYPRTPPKIQFLTKTYHPSIKQDTGEICQEALTNLWNSGTMKRCVLSVIEFTRNLFSNVERLDDSVVEFEIENEVKTNYAKFSETAKEYTLKYAL